MLHRVVKDPQASNNIKPQTLFVHLRHLFDEIATNQFHLRLLGRVGKLCEFRYQILSAFYSENRRRACLGECVRPAAVVTSQVQNVRTSYSSGLTGWMIYR